MGKGGCCWGVSPPWLQCGAAGAIELFMSDLDFWVGRLDCCKAKSSPGKCSWCYVLMSRIDNGGPVAAWGRGYVRNLLRPPATVLARVLVVMG